MRFPIFGSQANKDQTKNVQILHNPVLSPVAPSALSDCKKARVASILPLVLQRKTL
jgi:hypothetical protein